MTSPSGGPSLALGYLKTTLAGSSTFQTLVGAIDATAALTSIYLDSLPVATDGNQHTAAELASFRPYALLWMNESGGYEVTHESTDSAHRFRESGSHMMQIEQTVPSGVTTNNTEVELLWRNTIGDIIGEMIDLAGQATYLAITRISIASGPHRTHPDEVPTLGDSQWVDLAIEWGT